MRLKKFIGCWNIKTKENNMKKKILWNIKTLHCRRSNIFSICFSGEEKKKNVLVSNVQYNECIKTSCHKINDRSTIQYGVRNSQSKLHMVMKQYIGPTKTISIIIFFRCYLATYTYIYIPDVCWLRDFNTLLLSIALLHCVDRVS